jgi:hypothetical protein
MPMIKMPTVFILGAGASAPFGFPTGRKLLDRICGIADAGANKTLTCLAELGYDRDTLRAFGNEVRLSGMSSVDAFLEFRTEFLDIGKTLIAAMLIPHEETERLFEPKQDEFNWYKYVWGRMNTSFDAIQDNRVAFITYNYDRSLEHFLFTALQHSHNRTQDECAAVMQNVPVVHLHGWLANLPWHEAPGRTYDATMSAEALKLAADKIRVIHEDITNDPQFELARTLLGETQRVVFLGFGFHPTNVQRLFPDISVLDHKVVRCTAYGLGDAERQSVSKLLFGKGCPPPNKIIGHSDLDCLKLLTNHVVL